MTLPFLISAFSPCTTIPSIEPLPVMVWPLRSKTAGPITVMAAWKYTSSQLRFLFKRTFWPGSMVSPQLIAWEKWIGLFWSFFGFRYWPFPFLSFQLNAWTTLKVPSTDSVKNVIIIIPTRIKTFGFLPLVCDFMGPPFRLKKIL